MPWNAVYVAGSGCYAFGGQAECLDDFWDFVVVDVPSPVDAMGTWNAGVRAHLLNPSMSPSGRRPGAGNDFSTKVGDMGRRSIGHGPLSGFVSVCGEVWGTDARCGKGIFRLILPFVLAFLPDR
jgi:hypothetical protein